MKIFAFKMDREKLNTKTKAQKDIYMYTCS